jgi:WhiB family transcriptional regulator, redox-sensing transcriptional regulator
VSATYPLDGAICDGVATADYDPFFPATPEDELDALAMCRICPARVPCLAYAVETGQTFGIWGGKTQRQLRRLIRVQGGPPRRRVATGHGNASKTHCAYGHPYDSANTYYTPTGERRCRACRRVRVAHARRLARMARRGEH